LHILPTNRPSRFARAHIASSCVVADANREDVGHWVQQEAPAETNAALDAFVDTLG
jgi:pimeloyl-ACP methyl ester carboxylesterase